MKKILCLLIMFLLSYSLLIVKAGNAQDQKIQVQFFIIEPHVFLDQKTNKLTGAMYDLIQNYLTTEMGVEFVWDKEPTVIPRQESKLENEKNIASAVLAYSPNRAKIALFTDKPFFYDKAAIAVTRSNKLKKINSAEDLMGMTIGYAQKAYLSPTMKNDKLKFDLISIPNYHETNLKKAKAGRIDAVYAPSKSTLLYLIKVLNFENDFKILDLPDKPTPLHIFFSKDMKHVAEKYNKASKKLDVQKLYLKLLEKYIDVNKM